MHKNEKNYYEMLNLMPAATVTEIEDAFRRIKALYGEDSMAVYSLYSPEERQEKLFELDLVYQTLTDPALRKGYDQRLSVEADTGKRELEDGSIHSGKKIFEEFNEIEAFKSKLCFKVPLAVMDNRNDKMLIEKYRILYSRFEQMSLKKTIKSFCITSAVKGEGKTMTSLNLAYLMAAEYRKKVLLVECDLRNPSISNVYVDMGKLSGGLVDVLNGELDMSAGITSVADTSLYLLPAGKIAKNSSVLLDSPSMRYILSTARNDFDYVIVDSPPIFPLVDMNIISRIVDSTMLVVRADKTPKDIVVKAINSLPVSNVMGIVLNGATDAPMKKYYY